MARGHGKTRTCAHTDDLTKWNAVTNKEPEGFFTLWEIKMKKDKGITTAAGGGGAGLNSTAALKKTPQNNISLLYLWDTGGRVLAVLLALGPTVRWDHFVLERFCAEIFSPSEAFLRQGPEPLP